jgi:hypothetical protein
VRFQLSIGKGSQSVNVSTRLSGFRKRLDHARLTALEARGTESSNDQYRGNDKVMRERQRAEILRNLLAAQGFLSIVDSETRLTEAA